MIALCIAVTVLAAAALTGLLAFAYKADHRADDLIAAGHMVDQLHEETRSIRSDLNNEIVAHETTRAQLKQERDLRIAVEGQRDRGQAEYRELLSKHMGDASDEELTALTKEAFSIPLSLVPGNELMPPE